MNTLYLDLAQVLFTAKQHASSAQDSKGNPSLSFDFCSNSDARYTG